MCENKAKINRPHLSVMTLYEGLWNCFQKRYLLPIVEKHSKEIHGKNSKLPLKIKKKKRCSLDIQFIAQCAVGWTKKRCFF